MDSTHGAPAITDRISATEEENMNATAVERVNAPGQSGTLAGKQAGVQGPMSKATRDQAEAQLAEAQKAINALEQLLANPAQ